MLKSLHLLFKRNNPTDVERWLMWWMRNEYDSCKIRRLVIGFVHRCTLADHHRQSRREQISICETMSSIQEYLIRAPGESWISSTREVTFTCRHGFCHVDVLQYAHHHLSNEQDEAIGWPLWEPLDQDWTDLHADLLPDGSTTVESSATFLGRWFPSSCHLWAFCLTSDFRNLYFVSTENSVGLKGTLSVLWSSALEERRAFD